MKRVGGSRQKVESSGGSWLKNTPACCMAFQTSYANPNFLMLNFLAISGIYTQNKRIIISADRSRMPL